MSNNIVKHDQLEDIAGDLWTKAKKRDIERFEYDSGTKTLKGKNSVDTTLSIDVALTDLVSINDRAKFKKDVSVDKAGTANNLHIGTLNGDQSENRILGYRGLTSKVFVDGYVSELIVYAKSTLDVGAQTNWNVWAIKRGERREQDTVKATFHKNNILVESIVINGQAEKCVRLAIEQEFSEEVYFMIKSQNQQVKTCVPTDTYKPDVVNMSVSPSNTEGQAISWDTNNPANTAIMHLVGRESITSLAEKLRKTQADGIVTKVNNIAPGADGNVTITAENVNMSSTDTTNVKVELDKKISNITLKNDKKKLEITKATGTTSELDLTNAFVADNISYSGSIGGVEKSNVKEAINALNEEAKKGVKKINNGTPDDQGNIAVTVNQTGTTGITMTFGATGGTPVTVATYMTDQEVTAIKDLFV